MKFEVGDKVKFLNEVGSGVIKRIDKNLAYVDVDGFELPMKISELIEDVSWGKTPKTITQDVVEEPVIIPTISAPVEKEKPIHVIKEQPIINRYKTTHREAEIDMHIWELDINHRQLNTSDCLHIQLSFFKRCLESAIENNYLKVVFIHGVGNGILKTEIRKILDEYEFIDYYNASMAKYGVGATEVNIRHNK